MDVIVITVVFSVLLNRHCIHSYNMMCSDKAAIETDRISECDRSLEHRNLKIVRLSGSDRIIYPLVSASYSHALNEI